MSLLIGDPSPDAIAAEATPVGDQLTAEWGVPGLDPSEWQGPGAVERILAAVQDVPTVRLTIAARPADDDVEDVAS